MNNDHEHTVFKIGGNGGTMSDHGHPVIAVTLMITPVVRQYPGKRRSFPPKQSCLIASYWHKRIERRSRGTFT